MRVLFAALAVAAAVSVEPASALAQAETAAPEAPFPAGAPKDDYGLVAWCYGALAGYLDLYDQVMPEVKRIESEFRRPGSNLAADLAVYSDQRRQGQKDLKAFQRAMEAAEKASLRPINAQGAAALQKGRATWAAAPNLPKARLAQEWMSWSLPARCETTAPTLEQRARLMGTAFRIDPEPDPLSAPETGVTATPEAGAATTPDLGMTTEPEGALPTPTP
jgi:hypothetical protein